MLTVLTFVSLGRARYTFTEQVETESTLED